MMTMCGCRRWAIPFLDRYGTMLMGWLPIAPIGIAEWGGPWEFAHKKVRTVASEPISYSLLLFVA